jgi:hypothetical protein
VAKIAIAIRTQKREKLPVKRALLKVQEAVLNQVATTMTASLKEEGPERKAVARIAAAAVITKVINL